jgi:HD-GYP domain-containing protein (c-di-GMP phosphodiesterase class II)
VPGPSVSTTPQEQTPALNPKLTMILTAVILAAILITGAVAVWRYAGAERERDLYEWQLRLGLVADSRAAAVEDWLTNQRDVVEGLAQNTSLRLYVAALTSGITADSKTAAPNAGEAGYAAEYLATLLKATAYRSGFEAPDPDATLPANTPRNRAAGLAIIDASGKLLAGTTDMPALDDGLLSAMRTARGEAASLRDVYAGPGGAATIGFLAAIYGVQTDPGSAMPIGYVVGIRRLAPDLWTRLAQPGDVTKSGQTYLVRRSGPRIEFLSPLADGTAPLTKSVAADTPDLAEGFAIASPGGFGRARNYAGDAVLVTGRAIRGAPWTLVRTVAAAEALGAIEARRWRLLIGLTLLVAAVGLGFLLVWRHAVSVRMAHTAAENRRLADLHTHLAAFLKLVTDSQPTAIAVVNADNQYRFANARAAEDAGVAAADLDGKTLAAVLGPARAEPLVKLNRAVIETGETESGVFEWPGETGARHVKYDHIRVALEPGETSAGAGLGVLMIHEDITGLVAERERRERSLRALVSSLIMIIDKRDPYSAEHSIRVSSIAGLVAGEMGLSRVDIDTAQLAAALINVGKIFIPRDLLTKSGPLSEAELGLVRDNILASAELLSDVEFDGPVVETIRQVQAHWDGTGKPEGLAGEDILITARIVAVANAFVGMISPRAYRHALSLDSAVAALMDKANIIYDRRPVVALAHILDNRGGRELWARFGDALSQTGK